MKHTFVICAYKESPYIEECMESLKKQTCQSDILLATSTPSEYLEKLCAKYGIEYHVRDGVPSISTDWNYALSLVTTPYVTIAHQDDIYEPEYTEKMVEAIKKSGSIEKGTPIILFSDYSELVGEKKYVDRINLRIKRKLLAPIKKQKNQRKIRSKRQILRFGNAISCPTVTYHKKYIDKLLKEERRKDLFQQHFRSNLDWETWEWLSKKEGSFIYVPEVLVSHRIHEDSETTAIIQDNQRGKEDYEMFCKFWPRWIAKGITRMYSESEKSNEV